MRTSFLLFYCKFWPKTRASLHNATNKFSNPTFVSKDSHVDCSAALFGSNHPLMDWTRDWTDATRFPVQDEAFHLRGGNIVIMDVFQEWRALNSAVRMANYTLYLCVIDGKNELASLDVHLPATLNKNLTSDCNIIDPCDQQSVWWRVELSLLILLCTLWKGWIRHLKCGRLLSQIFLIGLQSFFFYFCIYYALGLPNGNKSEVQ